MGEFSLLSVYTTVVSYLDYRYYKTKGQHRGSTEKEELPLHSRSESDSSVWWWNVPVVLFTWTFNYSVSLDSGIEASVFTKNGGFDPYSMTSLCLICIAVVTLLVLVSKKNRIVLDYQVIELPSQLKTVGIQMLQNLVEASDRSCKYR